MVGFYGFNVGKYTVRPMDPMGNVLPQANQMVAICGKRFPELQLSAFQPVDRFARWNNSAKLLLISINFTVA